MPELRHTASRDRVNVTTLAAKIPTVARRDWHPNNEPVTVKRAHIMGRLVTAACR